MSAEPAISVLMPVHNCAAHVGEALSSILRQTWTDFECLVIDDGSTDATARICRSVAGDDPRVILLSKPNTGLVDSLNLGLMRARAPVIARMDGDDISFPHRFEEQLCFLRLSRSAALSSSVIEIDENGRTLGLHVPPDTRTADSARVPPREPYLPHPFMMFLRDVVLDLGGYRHCLHSEDADLCWRLFDAACIWNLREVHGKYRLHTGSVSACSAANARIQAVSACLAGIDRERRRAEKPPIRFDLSRELLPRADAFESLLDTVGPQLEGEEYARCAVGCGLRFLDFARLRRYPVTVEDVIFAKRAVARHGHVLKDVEWADHVLAEGFRMSPGE